MRVVTARAFSSIRHRWNYLRAFGLRNTRLSAEIAWWSTVLWSDCSCNGRLSRPPLCQAAASRRLTPCIYPMSGFAEDAGLGVRSNPQVEGQDEGR
jgi:hypothetical protein